MSSINSIIHNPRAPVIIYKQSKGTAQHFNRDLIQDCGFEHLVPIIEMWADQLASLKVCGWILYMLWKCIRVCRLCILLFSIKVLYLVCFYLRFFLYNCTLLMKCWLIKVSLCCDFLTFSNSGGNNCLVHLFDTECVALNC